MISPSAKLIQNTVAKNLLALLVYGGEILHRDGGFSLDLGENVFVAAPSVRGRRVQLGVGLVAEHLPLQAHKQQQEKVSCNGENI